MTSAIKTLTYQLLGKDVSASDTFGKTADSAESMSSRIGGAITKVGSQIGGELGELLDKGAQAFESFGNSGVSAGTKVAAAGAGIAGLGVALAAFGASDKQAEQQLGAAVNATGAAISDYQDQIDSAISKGEDFGHSAADVQNALTTLTTKTGDLVTALKYLPLVEDLAAAKHESLAAASTQLGQALDGNTRLFKHYGIQVASGTLSTQQITQYVTELAQRMSGQAAASSDTFTGKLEALRQKADGLAASFGNTVGPSLAFFGSAATIAGAAVDVLTFFQNKHTASSTAEIAADLDGTGALVAKTGAVEGATVAEVELAAAQDAEAASLIASLGPAAVFVGAMVLIGQAVDPLANKFGNWIDGNTAVLSSLKDVTKESEALAQSIQADGDAFGNNSVKTTAAALQSNGLAASFAKNGISLTQLTGAVGLNDQAYAAQIKTWQQTNGLSWEQVDSLGELHGAYDKNIANAKALTAATAGLNSETAAQITADETAQSITFQLGYTMDNTSSAFKSGADNATQYANALKEVNGQSLTAAQSQDSYQQGLNDLSKNISTTSKTLVGNTDAAITNRQALEQLITNVNDIATKQSAAGMSTAQVTANMTTNEAALRKQALAAGFSADQVDALVKQFETVPASVVTQMTLDDEAYLKGLSTVQDRLDYVAGLAASGSSAYGGVAATYNSTYSNHALFNGNASGGIIGDAAGGIQSINGIPVNEFGSELMDLGTGRIFPTGQSNQMKNNGASYGQGLVQHVYNITMPTVATPTVEDGRRVVAAIQAFTNSGGRTGF